MENIKNKLQALVHDKKGATMVEYAILLFLILVIAAAVYRSVGSNVSGAGSSASQQFGSH
jgi:Flp pilus assembly pilin Flp